MTEPTLDPATDYPLSVHRRDLLFTPNGKSIEDITIDASSPVTSRRPICASPQTPCVCRPRSPNGWGGGRSSGGRTCGARPR